MTMTSTSSSSSAADFFLRRLAENDDGGNGSGNSTNPAVFWGVNAFILFLLMTACCCCITSSVGRRREEDDEDDMENKRCGGRLLDCCFFLSRHLSPYGSTHETRQTSDEAYRAAVIRRRQREIDARRDSPEKRKRKILQSFKRCGVRMIVEAADILEPTENVGDVSDEAFAAELTSTPTTTSAIEGVLNSRTDDHDVSPVIACGIPMASPDENNDVNKDMDMKEAVRVEQQNEQAENGAASPAVQDQDEEEAAVAESTSNENAEAVDENANAIAIATEGDNADAASTASSEATNTDGYLLLRSSNKNVPRRRVPNCCAICLCPYEVGEAVVWSSNIQECPHAYHEECMLDWLVKMHQVQQHNAANSNNNNNGDDAENPPATIGSSLNSTPCPCCRADFTDLEKYRKERKIKWKAGNAFNPSTIAWR